MPAIGEVRSANGETRKWDGAAWRPVESSSQGIASSLASIVSPAGRQGLKDYGSELLSGAGTARNDALTFGKKEAGGFLSTLNPINQVKGVVNLGLHPIDSAKGMVSTAGDALTGDPEAIGNVLGMAALPKANASMLRGVNSAATATATNPTVRSGIGYLGGAGAALATGAGHPFMGGIMGRVVSPLLKAPAEEVASGSGWLMKKLGMNEGNASDTSGLTPADLTQLQQIESRNRALDAKGTTTIERPSQFEAEFPMGPDRGKITGGPKPKFSAADVVRMQRLMDQGLTAAQAADRVSGSSTLSRFVKIGPE